MSNVDGSRGRGASMAEGDTGRGADGEATHKQHDPSSDGADLPALQQLLSSGIVTTASEAQGGDFALLVIASQISLQPLILTARCSRIPRV